MGVVSHGGGRGIHHRAYREHREEKRRGRERMNNKINLKLK